MRCACASAVAYTSVSVRSRKCPGRELTLAGRGMTLTSALAPPGRAARAIAVLRPAATTRKRTSTALRILVRAQALGELRLQPLGIGGSELPENPATWLGNVCRHRLL